MALTNLASLDNVKSRIVAEKGISCFQYLQVQLGVFQRNTGRHGLAFCSYITRASYQGCCSRYCPNECGIVDGLEA